MCSCIAGCNDLVSGLVDLCVHACAGCNDKVSGLVDLCVHALLGVMPRSRVW